jgi:hypothetical protein
MSYTNGLDDPSAYFQTALYTGTGSTQSITNDGNSDMQPDWVWVKSRSNGGTNNVVFDSSRGVNNRLITNLTIVEDTGDDYGVVSAFNTDGFTVNPQTNLINVGGDGYTYVAWQWKANGGTTSSNTDGSITSTVQANQDAGFSIVTYGGTGSANTVGHGLADTPDVIIFKNRDDTNVWATYHQGIGNNEKLVLNTNAAEDEDGAFMNGTLPTSSVFSVGASVNTNGSGDNYVAYCFAEKQGYSKFSSYIGNGVANNGPFVYLGFKPRFLMIKSTTATGSHVIWDSKRSPFNGMDDYLVAAEADAEGTNGIFTIDAVSNGFKIMNTGTNNGLNQSSTKYVYYAFAENPFTTSTGIPATAR